MTLEQLLGRLRHTLGERVDQLYEDYCSEQGSQRPEEFLHYVYAKRWIDAPTLCDLHATGGIEVTQILDPLDPDLTRVLATADQITVALDEPERDPNGRGNAEGNTPRDPVNRQARPRTPSVSALARYELLDLLGKGAMGEVHLARDVSLRRKVAFKKVISDARTRQDILGRFFTEAQITSQLDHPNPSMRLAGTTLRSPGQTSSSLGAPTCACPRSPPEGREVREPAAAEAGSNAS